MNEHTFRSGFVFCGLGAGAKGFLRSRGRLGPDSSRFTNLGGIDIDDEACRDFETLTGVPAVREDVATLSPERLRQLWGHTAPDCVFMSPPCKGFSSLLSSASAAKEEYQRLNRLVLQGGFLLLETWGDSPPATIVIENVPRITSRGAELLGQVRDLFTRAGYRIHETSHDCGEIGGLAQHRRRYLLVARLERKVPAYIYRPPKLRVRACGEVLSTLPLPIGPEGAEAGPLHALPRISWLTWLRLAMIPPGGDWRDLPRSDMAGVPNVLGVTGWNETAGTVTGAAKPTSGSFSVADPRLAIKDSPNRHYNQFRVTNWQKSAGTVIGAQRPGSGAACVNDPRIDELVSLARTADGAGSYGGRPGLMSVADWLEATGAVTGSAAVTSSNGTAAVADPREIALGCSPRAGAYGVLDWLDVAATVTGAAGVDNGRFAVADPREVPATPPLILSQWGCWHRPMTTLELALLQGLPATIDGKPLVLAGKSIGRKRERIGNAVPVQAATAIGSSILQALLAAKLGTWTLSNEEIWVRRDGRAEHEWSGHSLEEARA